MDTSGYTSDIIDVTAVSQQFTDIHQVYSSDKGYTLLYRAMRYGKRFMLKCLKPEYTLTQIYQQALRKEFEIGFQLDHPNICRTLGFETVDTLGPCIILEYIDGITLAEAINRHDVTLLNAIKHQLLPHGELFSAVRYLHSKQVIHRDLKPSNIMITHNGNTLKLIDFSHSDSDGFAILKQAAGTCEYIAPEQYLPNAKADVRADIYSLGVIMSHLNTVIPDKAFSLIADQCCQHDPNKRPSSVSDIKTSLYRPSLILQPSLLGILITMAIVMAFYIAYALSAKGYL